MTHDHRTMAGDVPDVVPVLAFGAIDFVEQHLDVTPTDWQKRILIDLFGAGPEPDQPSATPTPRS